MTTRRHALGCLLGARAASSLLAQPTGVPPVGDLANVFEIRDVARTKLAKAAYDGIAGTDRRMFDRITFRPRLMVNVSKLDLSTTLLGQKLFAPIIVGPISNLQSYHPEGEIAMARGAGAGKALMVVSSKTNANLKEIAAVAEQGVWFQVYAGPDPSPIEKSVQRAVDAGFKAVCLTIGMGSTDWSAIERIRSVCKVPLVLKGVMSAEEAQSAAARRVDALVVSNHGGMNSTGFAEPIEVLPDIVTAVGNKVPVLVDGSFRRGTDILKALALGAKAVLVGRPAVWGLAAYGAEGVQAVIEMLQTELARNMALCGKPDLKSLDRTLIKIHRR